MSRPTLDEIGRKVGSDKSSCGSEPWMWSMGYCDTYDELFTPLRDKPITLLELGWGEWDALRQDHANPDNGGRSAWMWDAYFPHPDARFYFVDIERKKNTSPGHRTWLYDRTSQDDAEKLARLHEKSGDFDIIIDDASHVSRLTIASFKILYPYLKPGGFYCVEDLHTSMHSWWPSFAQDANEDPKKPRPDGGPTAMQFFKDLADEVNYHGKRPHGPDPYACDWDCYPRKYWRGHSIEWIRFSYQLCIIKKAQVEY